VKSDIASRMADRRRGADFNAKSTHEKEVPVDKQVPAPIGVSSPMAQGTKQTLGLNLGYTINLNLPATSDPEVFDAIFKSLKQHLLRDEDA
jgi:hypothetical protein